MRGKVKYTQEEGRNTVSCFCLILVVSSIVFHTLFLFLLQEVKMMGMQYILSILCLDELKMHPAVVFTSAVLLVVY